MKALRLSEMYAKKRWVSTVYTRGRKYKKEWKLERVRIGRENWGCLRCLVLARSLRV